MRPTLRPKYADGLRGDVVGVLLEAVGRVEQQRGPLARGAQGGAVHLDHGRRGLARPHDHQAAGHTSRPMSAATSSGCWACRSWSPPGNATSSACGDRRRGRARRRVARARDEEQRRALDLRVQLPRPVREHAVDDRAVPFAGEPGRTPCRRRGSAGCPPWPRPPRPTSPGCAARSRARSGLGGEPVERRRREDGPSVVERGEAVGELQPPPVDQRDPVQRPIRRELEHDVAAPRLTCDDRRAPAEVVAHRGEVVRGGQGGIRLDVGHLGGEAVAAQVDRHDGMPDEVARHQVPQPGVGRQPVHEEDRSTVAGERAGRETRADRDHLHKRQPMAARSKPPGRMGP